MPQDVWLDSVYIVEESIFPLCKIYELEMCCVKEI